MLRSLLQAVVFIAVASAVVVGLFIAWWIAVCAVLGLAAYLGLRRFLAGKGLVHDAGRGGNAPVVIEGQFEVEPEAGSQPRGRILDGNVDKN